MPPTNDTRTVAMHGIEIEVTHLKDRPGGGATLDIETDDRRWRVDVTATGDLDGIVTTWRDGQLATLEDPDWLGELLTRLAGAPA